MPIDRPHLDPARDEVVWGGEYELLGTGGLRGSQDHLPSSSSIWAGQDELLLGGSGGVHCGDYLDLLSCLLVCHNLQDTTWRLLSRSIMRLVYLQVVLKAVTAQCRPGVNAGPRCSFTSAWWNEKNKTQPWVFSETNDHRANFILGWYPSCFSFKCPLGCVWGGYWMKSVKRYKLPVVR